MKFPLTFDDVAVRFSLEEWAMLTEEQRALYRHVMEETLELVTSLEPLSPMPELPSRSEPEEVSCGVNPPHRQGETSEAQGSPSSDKCRPVCPKALRMKAAALRWGVSPQCPAQGRLRLPWLQAASRRGLDCHSAFAGAPLLLHTAEWRESAEEKTTPKAGASSGSPTTFPTMSDFGCLFSPAHKLCPLQAEAEAQEEPLSCTKCRRSFPEAKAWQAHQALHDNGKAPFFCFSCGKTFKHQAGLLTHKKHRGKQTYLCAQCGTQFCLKADLRHHQASHGAKGLSPLCKQPLAAPGRDQEGRPFVCAVCSKSFSWKESLRFHQRLHTGRCPLSAPSVAAVSKARPGSRRMAGRTSKPGRWTLASASQRTFRKTKGLLAQRSSRRRKGQARRKGSPRASC